MEIRWSKKQIQENIEANAMKLDDYNNYWGRIDYFFKMEYMRVGKHG